MFKYYSGSGIPNELFWCLKRPAVSDSEIAVSDSGTAVLDSEAAVSNS